jgi:hypothetical protein
MVIPEPDKAGILWCISAADDGPINIPCLDDKILNGSPERKSPSCPPQEPGTGGGAFQPARGTYNFLFFLFSPDRPPVLRFSFAR